MKQSDFHKFITVQHIEDTETEEGRGQIVGVTFKLADRSVVSDAMLVDEGESFILQMISKAKNRIYEFLYGDRDRVVQDHTPTLAMTREGRDFLEEYERTVNE